LLEKERVQVSFPRTNESWYGTSEVTDKPAGQVGIDLCVENSSVFDLLGYAPLFYIGRCQTRPAFPGKILNGHETGIADTAKDLL